jgi:hypothetical protein
MNLHFLTFGGPTVQYHDAVNRICKQAEQFELFDNIIGLTETDLQHDNEFWAKHEDFINSNPRGYGYWLWKPYIIKKTLESMNNGDVLFYADCGCELNRLGKNRFLELLDMVKMKNLMGTSACSTDLNYTKMDLIKYLKMENDVDLLSRHHMAATTLLMVKNEKIVNLINEYYETCSNNYHFINDSPSNEKNFDGFIEHRHDQSIFSLLVKKHNLINYDLDPSYWGVGVEAKQYYLHSGIESPIWTCRNKTGISIVD